MIDYITGEEFVAIVNQGSWLLVGGREAGFHAPLGMISHPKLLSASWDGDYVSLAIERRGQFNFPLCAVDFTNQGNEVRVIKTYIRREQKKKIDGGGWNEIPEAGTALRFMREKAVEKMRQARREREEARKRRQEEYEKKCREEAELARQRMEKEETERQAKFIADLNRDFAGHFQATIDKDGCLVLSFGGGKKLTIEHRWCDFDDFHTVVNGISLESFVEIDE